VIEMHPAYSSAFERESLASLSCVAPFTDVTPEWAWEGSTGRGVKVAVIDSGVEASHPAVGGVQGYVAVSEVEAGVSYVTEPHDDLFGHGTACAGIIRSLAPECELYSVRVLGPDLSGRGIIFADGLQWAIENGMDVCNLSLGTTSRDFYARLHQLADQAYFRNALLVTAANNMPIPSFPSVYASVVSVAATEEKDPSRFYYNPRPPVEFGAPGINLKVAWRENGWATVTGNSFAAPHITGIAARIKAKHPQLTPFQMKAVLWALSANVVRSSGALAPAVDPSS
jgi:subtilisin